MESLGSLIEKVILEYPFFPNTTPHVSKEPVSRTISQCFVINMEKDVDRLGNISTMLDNLKIPFTRLNAFNPHKSSYLTELKERFNLTIGEIGCLISHFACHYYAKKHINTEYQTDYVLIFEDDADTILDYSAWSKYLNSIDSILERNKNIEIIYLGKCHERCVNFNSFPCPDHDKEQTNHQNKEQTNHQNRNYGNNHNNFYKKQEPINKHLYVANAPLCMHAMIVKHGFLFNLINNKVMDKVVIERPIDYLLREYIQQEHAKDKIVALVYHPSLFFQDYINNDSNLRNNWSQLGTGIECTEVTNFLNVDNITQSTNLFIRKLKFPQLLALFILLVIIIILVLIVIRQICRSINKYNHLKV